MPRRDELLYSPPVVEELALEYPVGNLVETFSYVGEGGRKHYSNLFVSEPERQQENDGGYLVANIVKYLNRCDAIFSEAGQIVMKTMFIYTKTRSRKIIMHKVTTLQWRRGANLPTAIFISRTLGHPSRKADEAAQNLGDDVIDLYRSDQSDNKYFKFSDEGVDTDYNPVVELQEMFVGIDVVYLVRLQYPTTRYEKRMRYLMNKVWGEVHALPYFKYVSDIIKLTHNVVTDRQEEDRDDDNDQDDDDDDGEDQAQRDQRAETIRLIGKALTKYYDTYRGQFPALWASSAPVLKKLKRVIGDQVNAGQTGQVVRAVKVAKSTMRNVMKKYIEDINEFTRGINNKYSNILHQVLRDTERELKRP